MTMREIKMSGYIDDEAWFDDDITPETARNALCGEDGSLTDDVHITLNSYGGSVNAATQIHDIISAYPGKVHITVSGTAASAAVGLVMAADELDMTPGSMMMIHDPSAVCVGNARDMESMIGTLNAAKNSILNIYERRMRITRDEAADLMSAETWMDAKTALEYGFIDAITEKAPVKNSAGGEKAFNRAEAEKKVKAFYSRRLAPEKAEPEKAEPEKAMLEKAKPEEKADEGAKISARERRLRLLMTER